MQYFGLMSRCASGSVEASLLRVRLRGEVGDATTSRAVQYVPDMGRESEDRGAQSQGVREESNRITCTGKPFGLAWFANQCTNQCTNTSSRSHQCTNSTSAHELHTRAYELATQCISLGQSIYKLTPQCIEAAGTGLREVARQRMSSPVHESTTSARISHQCTNQCANQCTNPTPVHEPVHELTSA